MASEGKTKGRAAEDGAMRPLLERLKPSEAAAVLRRLLEAHPDLSAEAEEIARSLLHQVDYQEVAAEIEDEIRALDYEDLNGRAGSHEWGYVEPSEAAVEILEETLEPFVEDMKRLQDLGLEAEALEICKGVVLGCYRLSERAGARCWNGCPTSRVRRPATPWKSGMGEPTAPRVASAVEESALRLLRIS